MRGKARHFPTQVAPVEASVGIMVRAPEITLLLLLLPQLLIPPLVHLTAAERSVLLPLLSMLQVAPSRLRPVQTTSTQDKVQH